MTRAKNDHPHPTGHALVAVATIGALSMILAGGLELLGFLARANDKIARWVSRDGAESFPNHLAVGLIWLAAAVFAIALASAILAIPGQSRRLILWLGSLVVVAAWAPVLSLAAYAPEIAAPWIATLWSGVCALVYAANHRNPCEPTPAPADDPR